MAKDENGLNLVIDSTEADDDVVDLLEVVKPGKVFKKSDADEDFSADLESMLDTLSEAEQAKAAEERIQPFPDPTPVEHEVDAHESLDMPGMDDFDNILNALGAPPSPDAHVEQDEQDEDEQDAMAAPMPDLDAVPAAHSAAMPAAPKAPPSDEELLAELAPELNTDSHFSAPVPETTPVDLDGLPPGIGTDATDATALAEADDALSLDTTTGDIASESLDMESAPEPVVPAAPDTEDTEEAVLPIPTEDASDAQRFDEVDLNELDALLDDMLASAPASGPGPTAPSEQVAQESGDFAAVAHPALRGMEAKVEDVELTMHNLDSRITALEKRQNELYANIDKLAAEAAAKIIREELAALLKAGG